MKTRMETLNGEKGALRREMKALRRGLSPVDKAAADAAICKLLAERRDIRDLADCGGGASPLAAYLASRDEINIDPFLALMLHSHVDVVVPRWNGRTYELARLKGIGEEFLRPGPMGIREPIDADIVPPGRIRAWIVPGLAFASDGLRLGYGGGWYDRFLAAAPREAAKIGVAYPFQLVADLPREPHDILLSDIVVPPL